MKRTKQQINELKEEVADLAVNLFDWEEVQQDDKTSMISFEKHINDVKFRINIYLSKSTVVIQSKYYSKQITTKNANLTYIEAVLEDPLYQHPPYTESVSKPTYSIDFLRAENERLRNENLKLKTQLEYAKQKPKRI